MTKPSGTNLHPAPTARCPESRSQAALKLECATDKTHLSLQMQHGKFSKNRPPIVQSNPRYREVSYS